MARFTQGWDKPGNAMNQLNWPYFFPRTTPALEQDFLGFTAKKSFLQSFSFWIFFMMHWQPVPLQNWDQIFPEPSVKNNTDDVF